MPFVKAFPFHLAEREKANFQYTSEIYGQYRKEGNSFYKKQYSLLVNQGVSITPCVILIQYAVAPRSAFWIDF